jgi:basic membrane protein A and related proteins
VTDYLIKTIRLKALFVTATLIALTALVAACGDDPTPRPTTAPATATPTTEGAMEAMVPGTSPSVEDLAGGSPAAFGELFAAAIAGSSAPAASEYAKAAAGGDVKVGFIFVGSEQDLGYNQAAYEGSLYVAEQHPDVEILYAENIPETAQVKAVMGQMIQQGASVIFATSYGYSAFAKEMAVENPDVIFLHMGDVESTPNYGAFFGNIWQIEYAAGKAAGSVSKTGKLGFVAAFPIPQTLLNINAFTLGAQSVNPDITTTTVLLSAWCDPAKQAATAQILLDAGVDVLTQHQDCTGTITRAAEAAGVYVSGYHADASSAAPNGWITGAIWNWGPVYSELVQEILDGTYKSSVFFGGLSEGFVKLAPFGAAASTELQKVVNDAVEEMRAGTLNPFEGPIKDQDGVVRIAAGESYDDAQLQTMNWLVEGVEGSF